MIRREELVKAAMSSLGVRLDRRRGSYRLVT